MGKEFSYEVFSKKIDFGNVKAAVRDDVKSIEIPVNRSRLPNLAERTHKCQRGREQAFLIKIARIF